MNIFLNTLMRFRAVIACASILIIILFSNFILSIKFENSVESFIDKSNSDYQFYQNFKKTFGEDQVLALAFPVENVFSSESIALINEISSKLKSLDEVRKVRSITTAEDIVGENDSFEVEHLYDQYKAGSKTLAEIRDQSVVNDIYKVDLFSQKLNVASILIEAKVDKPSNRFKNIIKEVHGIMSSLDINEYYLAGDPVVELQLTEDMWHDLKIFMPMTFLVLFLLLYLCFQNLGFVWLGLLIVFLCSAVLLGLIGSLGITMNGVTAGLPSLIMCVAVMDCVHIMSAYKTNVQSKSTQDLSLEDCAAKALKDNFIPCFLTSLTTAVGFASICISEIVPIQEFGFLAAIVTLIALPICYLVMPYFLIKIKVKQVKSVWLQSTLNQIFLKLKPLYERKYIIGIVSVVVLITSAQQIKNIKVETVFLNFFNESTQLKVATNFIQKELGGVSSLEISIDTGQEEGVFSKKVVTEIEKLQNYINSLEGVDKTVSVVEFLKEINQAMNQDDIAHKVIPSRSDLIAQYIFTYGLSGRDNDLNDFLNYDYSIARIRGRMQQSTSEDLSKIIANINSYIKENTSKDLNVKVTSYSVIQTSMIKSLIDGQINGLLIAFVVMLLSFWFISKSLYAALLSMVPNIIPIAASIILMNLLGYTLNAGTAMIACITFGLVVDDTIHFLHHMYDKKMENLSKESLIQVVLKKVGVPVVFSGLILASGFSVLLLGDSFFTFSFGLLCAFSIVIAVVSNILLMPYLVHNFSPVLNKLKSQRGAISCAV